MNKPRKRKNESDEKYYERASKLYYSNGYYIKEIANKLGISDIKVYNYVTNNTNRITTEEERQEMIKLFNQGYSYNAIGRMLHRNHSCVKERIERPAKIVSSNNHLTDKQIEKIKQMLIDGETVETISKELNISKGIIRCRIRNIEEHKHFTHVSKDELKQYIKLYKKGKSYSEIAKIYGRHKNTVSRHIRKIKLSGK